MRDDDILILRGDEIASILAGQESKVIEAVRLAYVTHRAGDSSLPHSSFLRFPGNDTNRIIALPAYLGGDFRAAGIKWIASFPGNLDKGLDRASAVVILNSTETGRPRALLEGSIISARRTAASAALAAKTLHADEEVARVSLLGCGVINFEIVRFLQILFPRIKSLTVFDIDPKRAGQFKQRCQDAFAELEVSVAKDVNAALRSSPLISIATTAIEPHIFDLSPCAAGSTILHISLRDLSPEAILSSDNIVDDIDHVCRAKTSVHLASELAGTRSFIRCTLADILTGATTPRETESRVAVFSPFGLGVLDLAVSMLVYDLGIKQNRGTIIKSFLPDGPAPHTGGKES